MNRDFYIPPGQMLQVLIRGKKMDAYVIRHTEHSVRVKLRDGTQHTIRNLDNVLPYFHSGKNGLLLKYDSSLSKFDWAEFITSPLRIGQFDAFLVEALWYTINWLGFDHKLSPIKEFLVDRMDISGQYDPNERALTISPAPPPTLKGLTQLVAHEMVHQWQVETKKIDITTTNSHDDWHENGFKEQAKKVGSKLQLPIPSEGFDFRDSDIVDSSDETLTAGSGKSLYYLTYKGQEGYNLGVTEDSHLALSYFDAVSKLKAEVYLFGGTGGPGLHGGILTSAGLRKDPTGVFYPIQDNIQKYLIHNMKILKSTKYPGGMNVNSSEEVLAFISGEFTPFIGVLAILLHEQDKTPKWSLQLLAKWETSALNFLKKFKANAGEIRQFKQSIADFKSATTTEHFEKLYEDLAGLAKTLRRLLPNILKDRSIPHEALALMKDALASARGSEPSYLRFKKSITLLGDTQLNQLYAVDVEHPKDKKSTLQQLVQKLTGKKALDIPPNERAAYQSKKPAVFKEFLKARRDLLQLGKDKISQIVKSSGKTMIPMSQVQKALDAGSYVYNLPQGFDGLIDAQSKFYTTAGKSIGVPPTSKIRMNPKYDPDADNTYVLQAYPTNPTEKSGWQAYYTDDYRQKKNVEKYSKVADLTPLIEEIRAKWVKDLVPGSKVGMRAAILEIGYQTQARVGGRNKNNTFGITTLLAKHFKFNGNKLQIGPYPGKGQDGTDGRQKHFIIAQDVGTKRLFEFLKLRLHDLKPSSLVFTLKGGAPITGQFVNAYFRALGSPVTIHKLRTFKGSLMAKELLANPPKNLKGSTPGAATEWLKKQLLQVGKQLGHLNGNKPTAMTALKSYIFPDVLQGFYDRVGVRPPPLIEKIIKQGTKSEAV